MGKKQKELIKAFEEAKKRVFEKHIADGGKKPSVDDDAAWINAKSLYQPIIDTAIMELEDPEGTLSAETRSRFSSAFKNEPVDRFGGGQGRANVYYQRFIKEVAAIVARL